MKKESFVFYRSFADALQKLPCEQFCRIMKHIFEYAFEGVEGEMDVIDGVIFELIKPQLFANNQRYQNGCKGAEFGKLGGRPKKPQENPTETPKKPQENPTETPIFERKENEDEKEKATKEKVEDKEKEKYIKEKSTSVLKKKGEENFEDLDGRTDGQDKPFCVEDDKTAKQREFFQLYPNVVVDNYSSSDYAEIDFNILIGRFEESAYLRSRNSFAWICSNWRKIAVGEYRDFDRRFERQERHSQKLGSEWDDLD
jgi:hypothetical protein